MKKYCFLIFLSLISHINLYAELDCAGLMKSPTRQKLFLLYDTHDQTEGISNLQLEALINVIKKRETNPTDKKMIIFIEYPASCLIRRGMAVLKDILYGLIAHTEQLNLKQTEIKDAEIRRMSGGAIYFLDAQPLQLKNLCNVLKDEQCAAILEKRFGCKLDTITFQNLLDHHKLWQNKGEQYRDSWTDPVVKEQFDYMLREAASDYDAFNASLPSIDLNTTFHDYVIVQKTNESTKEKLIKDISTAFCVFLNIQLFHTILSLQQEPYDTIVLCAGSYHLAIFDHLEKTGYQQLSHNWPHNKNNYYLSPEGFSLLLSPLEELEAQSERNINPSCECHII